MPRRLISTGSPFETTAGYDYATMSMPEAIEDQTRNCFRTISQTLAEGGFALADIVRATYYVTSRADADRVLPICGEILAAIRPAATLLIVAGLFKPEMKVEIEVTARRRAAA